MTPPDARSGHALVRDGYLVTMDPERRCIPRGFVRVRDGAVASIGPMSKAPDPEPDEAVVDARGGLVVPGLINTHQHHWYNLFKGLGGGMLLEEWVARLQVPTAAALTPGDLAAAARLASLEMLATGTTTFLNHSVTATGEPEVEATIRPVLEAGLRQVFAKEIRPEPLDEQLALAEAIHSTWHGAGGLVSIGFAIESSAHWVALGTCSEELVIQGDALAGRLGARITDHIAGGTMSRERGYLRFVLETGRTDVEFLANLGVLDEKWILAHVLHPRDRDIDLITGAGAGVSHTPTSESARGGGIAPIRRFVDAGVRVALGSDGPMVDTSVDMVEQMKAALLLQNQLHADPRAITPERALAMATIEAAALLGLDDRIGSIEPGKCADLAIFDLSGPAAGVWHDPIAALVQSLRGRDATHVLVGGVPLVRDGRLTGFDDDAVEAIVSEARERSLAALERAGIRAPSTFVVGEGTETAATGRSEPPGADAGRSASTG